jgi:hypothetical protein
MKVYHGSSVPIDEIDLSKCKPHKDFGRGFYVTKLYEQARIWADTIGKESLSGGFVTEFEFHEYVFEDDELRTLRFEDYDDAWLDFVAFNRNKLNKVKHGYDIVEGPVADDYVSYRIKLYLRGKLSRARFLEELKFKRPTHQICLCSKRALQAIEAIELPFEFRLQLLEEAIMQMLIDGRGMNDEQAMALYTDSMVYAQVNDEETRLYKQPWTEIYKMLLREKVKR